MNPNLLIIQQIVARADREVLRLQQVYSAGLQGVSGLVVRALSLKRDEYGKFSKVVKSNRFIKGVVRSISPQLLNGVKDLLLQSARISIGQLALLPNARDIASLSPLSAEKIVEGQYVSLLDNFKDVTKGMQESLKREVAAQFVAPKTPAVSNQFIQQIGEKAAGQAKTIVSTALASTQRQVTEETLQAMSGKSREKFVIYMGPDDNLTRPFCEALVGFAIRASDIAKLNNHQKGASNVSSFCGGWNCRHRLVPVTKGFVERRNLKIATRATINKANAAAAGKQK